jgi:hypothetical protein
MPAVTIATIDTVALRIAHALSQQLEHPIFPRREEHAGTVDGNNVGGGSTASGSRPLA